RTAGARSGAHGDGAAARVDVAARRIRARARPAETDTGSTRAIRVGEPVVARAAATRRAGERERRTRTNRDQKKARSIHRVLDEKRSPLDPGRNPREKSLRVRATRPAAVRLGRR